ncbi:AAA family ATPase [Curtobacterium sp. MCLR17_036]|uniref:AAA family ATPase n=1 Tax=Curtobacterium sp. MCLR17_036 TaxID=2175620 RepID=UPI000DA99D28|nr:AAA family ATPase [Curtobacterium sp. MCLR17_036]WIE64238.1 AAA family ATPase [Curtobacterium sp. MCLR17_036]
MSAGRLRDVEQVLRLTVGALRRAATRTDGFRTADGSGVLDGLGLWVDEDTRVQLIASDGVHVALEPVLEAVPLVTTWLTLPPSFVLELAEHFDDDDEVSIGLGWIDDRQQVVVTGPGGEPVLHQTMWTSPRLLEHLKGSYGSWGDVDGQTSLATVDRNTFMKTLVTAEAVEPSPIVTLALAPERVLVRGAAGLLGDPVAGVLDGRPRRLHVPVERLRAAVRFVCWTAEHRYESVALHVSADGSQVRLWGTGADGSSDGPECFVRTSPDESGASLRRSARDEQAAARDEAEPDDGLELLPPLPPAQGPEAVAAVLAELDAVVGQAQLKAQVRNVVAQAELVQLRRDKGLHGELTAGHLLFVGPPGTGKTTIGRLVARLYHALGFLPSDTLVEVDRAALVAAHVGGTEERTTAAVERAMGGVLLVDEAYALTSGGENDFGRQALDTLLKALEDRRGSFVCIAAGYPTEMDAFTAANPGIASRFPQRIEFTPYSADELVAIAVQMASDSGAVLTSEAVDRLGLRLREAEVSGRFAERTWGNARTVRTVVDRAATARDARLSALLAGAPGLGGDTIDGDALVEIREEDVVVACDDQGVGRLSAPTEDVETVLAELRAQIGQDQVARQVESLVANARAARAAADRDGRAAVPDIPHLLFTGPPGTGKTTIARLIARLYRALGLLPGGTVVEVDRGDLVAGYVGQTATKTTERIDEAMGGVLFVDEAYALTAGGDAFGREAVDTLLKRMEDDRGRFLVIAAGYPEPMADFLRSNPGLARRFPTTIEFRSYSAEQLAEIATSMAAARNERFTEDAARALRARLSAAERSGLFARADWGNAGAVRNLVDEAVRVRNTRVFADGTAPTDGVDLDQIDVADVEAACRSVLADDGPAVEAVEDVLAELEAQIGQPGVKRQVESLMAGVRAQQARTARGMSTGQVLVEHLVFTGPPGTGKTTIARLLARLYRALGVLPSGHVVEVDAAGLVAGYVGQTATKTEERITEARGGVLFIDEAYTLATDRDRSFGQEAIDTLLARMENDRGAFMVIVAGYPDEMAGFLRSNPGLPSRFTQTIAFRPYSAADLVGIAEHMAVAAHEQFTEDARELLVRRLTAAEDTGRFSDREWGNGRAVRNILDDAVRARDLRLFADPSSEPSAEEMVIIEAVDVTVAADAAALPAGVSAVS